VPPTKPRPRPAARVKPAKDLIQALKPILPAVITPVVAPVMERLDRHEQLLLDVKRVLDVQFERIASMQAQLDLMIAERNRR
jgi:hypothetical protein